MKASSMFIPLILMAGVFGYATAELVDTTEKLRKKQPAPAVQREYEFVCYTDDKLTERHVGVVSAIQLGHGDYSVRYKEGTGGSYRPLPGELCGLERVP